MNTESLIGRLEGFAETLPAVVACVPDDDARWRPDENSWSILEIVTHVADEEIDDFRKRVELTLRDPGLEWPPIDPEGAAVERRYNEGDLREVVARFVAARQESVAWLNGLHDPDWSKTYRHKLGDIRAGDVLASWVAHDALHLRQIAKRMFQLTQRDAGDYSTSYAGSW
jgi:hypothetical protein